MPKGVYTRRSGRRGSEEEPEKVKEEEESGDDGEEEDEDKKDSDNGRQPKKRKKKRKALFTREKPARRQRAIERANERQAKIKEARERGNTEESVEEEKEEKEEELTFPQPSKEALLAFTPLQLLLDHLIRTFYRKDPEEYFVFPVTDDVAPDYSEVVSEQMNYFTMRGKIDRNEYATFEAFKTDVHLIIKNAFAYNKPHTVYWAAAKKLEQMAALYFSRSYMVSLAQTKHFVREISVAELGMGLPSPVFTEQVFRGKRKGPSVVLDNMTANEVLGQVQRAAEDAKQKLATFRPNTKMGFLNRKEDGTTVLNIITPELVEDETGSEEKKRRITLGDILPRPKEGNPGLAPWNESPENLLAPVNFLNYGPFASFAPQVDSTWATLDKDLSAKLLATYGEPDAVEYAWSLRNFVAESGDYLIGMVDSLLDTLTNGEHSKLHGNAVEDLAKAEGRDGETDPVDWEGLRSLESLGMDMSFLGALGAPPPKPESNLEATGRLLGQLEAAQNARLSQPPGLTVTNVGGAGEGEVELAGAVVQKLSRSLASVKPSEVVGEREIRECLGIADDIDMDVLREFLVPD